MIGRTERGVCTGRGQSGLCGTSEIRYDNAIDPFDFLGLLMENWQSGQKYEPVGLQYLESEQIYELESVSTTTDS